MPTYFTQIVVDPEIPAHLLDEETRQRLDACGLTCLLDERHDRYYIYSEENVGSDEEHVRYDHILQEVLAKSKGALPYLTVEAALTCSKPLPDGFGGFAIFITADDIEYMSTAGWLVEKMQANE